MEVAAGGLADAEAAEAIDQPAEPGRRVVGREAAQQDVGHPCRQPDRERAEHVGGNLGTEERRDRPHQERRQRDGGGVHQVRATRRHDQRREEGPVPVRESVRDPREEPDERRRIGASADDYVRQVPAEPRSAQQSGRGKDVCAEGHSAGWQRQAAT